MKTFVLRKEMKREDGKKETNDADDAAEVRDESQSKLILCGQLQTKKKTISSLENRFLVTSNQLSSLTVTYMVVRQSTFCTFYLSPCCSKTNMLQQLTSSSHAVRDVENCRRGLNTRSRNQVLFFAFYSAISIILWIPGQKLGCFDVQTQPN